MAESSKQGDDLDAVRLIVEALKPFTSEDQRRIIRWAQEKAGLLPTAGLAPGGPTSGSRLPLVTPQVADIRTFVQQKSPASDVQFAAVVAYFFAFEASDALRKSEISPSDLQEAARHASRRRLAKPADTLNNAIKLGYLDKGQTKGTYRINTVGENLVAMALPSTGGGADHPKKTRPGRKPKARKAAKPGSSKG